VEITTWKAEGFGSLEADTMIVQRTRSDGVAGTSQTSLSRNDFVNENWLMHSIAPVLAHKALQVMQVQNSLLHRLPPSSTFLFRSLLLSYH